MKPPFLNKANIIAIFSIITIVLLFQIAISVIAAIDDNNRCYICNTPFEVDCQMRDIWLCEECFDRCYYEARVELGGDYLYGKVDSKLADLVYKIAKERK